MNRMPATAPHRALDAAACRMRKAWPQLRGSIIGAWRLARYGVAALLVAVPWLPGMSNAAVAFPVDGLAHGFREPPPTAWPHVVWRWSDDSITAERITADLTGMKAAGISGALIVRATGVSDPSRGKATSDERDRLLAHAMHEAGRLGLDLGVHFSSGWDSDDDSLIPPMESARKLTWIAQRFQGGGNPIVANLAAPPAEGGGYEEIAVLASPVPPPAAEPLAPTPWRPSSPWDRRRSIDLTSSMNSKGRLEWKAPPGFWNVLRIGSSHTIQGVNWGPNFREEFQKRRGYDPTPFLPLALAWTDLDPVIGQRFTWDMRTTLAEEVQGRKASQSREFASSRGLLLAVDMSEGATRTPRLEPLNLAEAATIPLGAFRVDGEPDVDAASCFWARSAGHVHGKQVIGARAHVAWAGGRSVSLNEPAIQSRVNTALCAGANRIYLPAEDGPASRKPRPWLVSLARCQHLLQSGLPVVDICHLDIDNGAGGLAGSFLAGYAADVCTAEILRSRMTVDGGELKLSEGLRYRVLLLPSHGRITPQVLKTTIDLARAGATVAITARPTASPSLEGHPACDEDVVALTKDLCGDAKPPGRGFMEVACGGGRVFLLAGLADLPAAVGLPPALTLKAASDATIRWTHRRTADAEIYFLANLRSRDEAITGTFRVSGMASEIWDPDTGEIRPTEAAKAGDGATRLSLKLGPNQALFVVFRKSARS